MKRVLLVCSVLLFGGTLPAQFVTLEVGWNNSILHQPVMNQVIDTYNRNHPDLTNPLDHFNWVKGPQFCFSTYSDRLDFYFDMGWRSARCKLRSTDSLGVNKFGIMRGRMFNVGFGLEFLIIHTPKFRWGLGGGLNVLSHEIIFGETLFENTSIKVVGTGSANTVTDVHSNFLVMGKAQSTLQFGTNYVFSIRPFYEIGIYKGNYFRFAQALTPDEAALKVKSDYKQSMAIMGITLSFGLGLHPEQ